MCALGPDWSYGNDDGGVGNRGVVDEIDNPGHQVPRAWVKWPNGARKPYQFQLKDELRVVQSVNAKLSSATNNESERDDFIVIDYSSLGSGASSSALLDCAAAVPASTQPADDISEFIAITGANEMVARRLLSRALERSESSPLQYAVSTYFDDPNSYQDIAYAPAPSPAPAPPLAAPTARDSSPAPSSSATGNKNSARSGRPHKTALEAMSSGLPPEEFAKHYSLDEARQAVLGHGSDSVLQAMQMMPIEQMRAQLRSLGISYSSKDSKDQLASKLFGIVFGSMGENMVNDESRGKDAGRSATASTSSAQSSTAKPTYSAQPAEEYNPTRRPDAAIRGGTQDPIVGDLVVRGPNWTWGDQDGGMCSSSSGLCCVVLCFHRACDVYF